MYHYPNKSPNSVFFSSDFVNSLEFRNKIFSFLRFFTILIIEKFSIPGFFNE